MFYFEGNSYELPVKTMALNDKIEAVNNARSTNESYRKMMEFVIAGLGKEKVEDLLGTSDIMKVNLQKLNKLANAIVIGYDLEISEQQLEAANNMANSDAIKKLIDAGKSAQYLQTIKK